MAIKIYIDQGHNPENPNAGAEGNGYREQDVVYRIGILLRDLLLRNGNFEVRVSRPTITTQLGNSTLTSLSARTSAANAWGADYFISLHTNASTSPIPSGTEAYLPVPRSISSGGPLCPPFSASLASYQIPVMPTCSQIHPSFLQMRYTREYSTIWIFDHLPSIRSISASSMIFTPSRFASLSFEPASSPATT